MDSTVVLAVTITNISYTSNLAEALLNLSTGTHLLKLRMISQNSPDSAGIQISQVALR
jgi:hypothetical protein